MLFLSERPPIGKALPFSQLCLKKGTIPTSFTGMLWSLSVRKVRLWNKRHSKKAKHYYLWSSMKYKNIHTDDLCILRGFFYNLGYLWSLRVTISILFQNVLLCKDILAGKGTQRNLWDESAWNTAPAAQAPNLAGSFLHGKKIPTITTVPCPETCFHLSKPNREVWTAWGCGKKEEKLLQYELNYYQWLSTDLLPGVIQAENTISVSGK